MRALRLTVYALLLIVTHVPARSLADHRVGSERIDFTAYTLRQNELSIGIGAAAWGVIDEITVGTCVPLWFAFPFVDAPIASGYLKVRDWFHGPLAASLRAAVAYLPPGVFSSALSTAQTTTRVGFVVVPIELSLSLRANDSFSQSLQVSWVYVGANGSRARDARIDLRIGGVSAVTSLSLHLLSELRLSPLVALTMRESILLGSGDLLVSGQLERGGTRVDADLGATQLYNGVVANVIPGIAFSWSNINLHVGVGVGTNWLPFLGLPIRSITVVPDADFYVRF
ncbi:MAG TPA: hypothetical protein VMF89_34655 [Polyangiales bacterium]|nr:hypothetical protein [Polyangiales bacterium]